MLGAFQLYRCSRGHAQDIGMSMWYVSNSFVLVVILLGVHKNELILLCHVKVLIICVWGNC